MKNIAVLLSGCGVYDGTEIHETVCALLALDRAGVKYQCVAPDITQHHVINHLSGEVMPETRNVLVESARIARGNIKSLADVSVDEFDGLIVPGGFGAVKNLSDFAFQGTKRQVEPSVLAFCQAFAKAGKPAGYICISPTLVSAIYGDGVKVTIGDDKETSQAIEAMGGIPVNCTVDECCMDAAHKVATCPAYMLANSISEIQTGIDKCVQQVINWS